MNHTKSIFVYGVSIPANEISKLNDEERWAYYLLGYIANELNCLLKLLSHSLNLNSEMERHCHMPELIQSSILFRLAAGKSYEAMLQLRTKEFRKVYLEVISKHLDRADDRWNEVNKAFNQAKWLSKLRNKVIFHYPSVSDWAAITKPNNDWEDDQMFYSEGARDIFFDASEVIGQNWALMEIGNGKTVDSKEDAQQRYEKLISTTISLSNLLRSFVMDSLAVFIADHLCKGNPESKSLGSVTAVDVNSINIPTWIYSSDDLTQMNDLNR